MLTIPALSETQDIAYITPSVELKLGDRTYSMRLTCQSIINVVERDGKNSILDTATWVNLPPEDLAELVHACIQHNPNVPTVKEIHKYLDTPVIKAVMDALSETWNLAQTGETRPFRLKTVA